MTVSKAVDNAVRLRAGEPMRSPAFQHPTRRFAIGDPQSSSEERGGVRTLVVDYHGRATYRRGVHPVTPHETVMYMIDPEMHYVAGPSNVAVLPLE